jgi:hypothetical protein
VRVQVADLLAEGACKVRVAQAKFDFKPVKTWLGRQATEKVDGWACEVRWMRADRRTSTSAAA